MRGFSLVECLVSMFILSVGMLGLLSASINTMRFNRDAYVRSIATAQANSIIERMRANPAGISSGHYNNLSGIPSSKPICTSACSSAQIKDYDLHEWNTRNSTLLPNGQGTVQGNGEFFTVTIRWDMHKTGATGLSCSKNPNVDLTCMQFGVQL